MKVVIKQGEALLVSLEGTDGLFVINYDHDHDYTLTVRADLPDDEGREGVIYCESFGDDLTEEGIKKDCSVDETEGLAPQSEKRQESFDAVAYVANSLHQADTKNQGYDVGLRWWCLGDEKKVRYRNLAEKAVQAWAHKEKESAGTDNPYLSRAMKEGLEFEERQAEELERGEKIRWTVEGVGDLRRLERHHLVAFLEQAGIACFDNESDEVLREALKVNLEDGTVPKGWIDMSELL